MNIVRALAYALLLLQQTSLASAQTGALDQSCVGETHGLNAGSIFHWQQEVRAGSEGFLEGIKLNVQGFEGCDFNLNLYRGEGPATGEPDFTTLVTNPGDGVVTPVFVDTREAAFHVAADEFFTFEVTGDPGDDIGESCDVKGGQDDPYPRGDQWEDSSGEFVENMVIDIAFETYLVDSIVLDAGVDAGGPDAGNLDAGTPDSGNLDAGAPDSGTVDVPTDSGDSGCGCHVGPRTSVPASYATFALLLAGLFVMRVRRARR